MGSREIISNWTRSRPWTTIVLELAILLLFVLSSTHLARH